MFDKLSDEFPVMVEFMGATYAEEDGEKVYRALNAVSVNPFNVSAFYDHTILLGGNKIRVMETYDEIKQKTEDENERKRWLMVERAKARKNW